MIQRVFRAALLHGLGRSYGAMGHESTNCVRLVADILDDVLPVPLTREQRQDILISHGDPLRPWSGIGALVQLGHDAVPLPLAGRVHVVQRWLNLDHEGRIGAASRGHAFLWVASKKAGDLGMVIEATSRDNQWVYDTSWSAVGHLPGWTYRLVALLNNEERRTS